MTHKKRLLVGPAVPDKATLESIVARIAHYLSHVDVESVVVAVTPELARADVSRYITDPDLPSGFDAEVLERVRKIAPLISTRVVGPDDQVSTLTADYLLFWDTRAQHVEPWATAAGGYRQNRTTFDLDWERTRSEGGWFAELSRVLSTTSRRFSPQESSIFRARTEQFLGAPTAYLVATGPSARDALDVDMSGGVRIVCNTTILDDELMDHVQPQIVTFADPIFHFGPSTYAYQFQRALGRLAARHDITVVTLERFAVLLRHRHPELADRVVGVRLGLPTWPQNFDLMAELAVRPYPNILTMLMLPLAATFSRSIELAGFDGRDPKDTYFWRHGETVQFDRELSEIRLVHPGFFDVDYDDYYEQHMAAVEQLFLDIEVRGGVIRSRSPSFLRPLRRRAAPDVATAAVGGRRRRRRPSAPVIASVTPDWTGSFGHFGPWERAVGDAARARGYEYRSLASRALELADASVLPTFTHGTLHRENADQRRFERELRAGIDAAAGDVPAIVCFYTADIWHLPSILNVAAERPESAFAVNLMRAHDAIAAAVDDAAPTVAMRLLDECASVAHGRNVHLCLDTDAIVTDLEQATGHRLLTWPMVLPGDPQLLGASTRPPPGGPLRVIAPVHAQMAKGFPQLADLAERMSTLLLLGEWELIARFAPQPGGMSAAHMAVASRFQDAGGGLIRENLTDRGYATLVGRADVVLLPYRRSTFRTRTSGVLLDAIAAGKPVVAVRGTWAGDLIEQFALGATYEDDDVDALEAALVDVVTRLDECTGRVEVQRHRLIGRYLPTRLVDFLAQLSALRNAAPDPLELASLRRFADLAAFSHWRDDATLSDERLRSFVEVDNVQRFRDDAHDQIELLRRANMWRESRIRHLTGEAPPQPEQHGADGTPLSDARPSDAIDGHVYDRLSGAHLDELALVAAIVRPELVPGGVMVDVGAHTGSAFTSLLEAGWRVHAFEPDPRRAEYLAERYGRDGRVVLDFRAVSNGSGARMTLYVSDESTGISGLSAFHDSHVPLGDVEIVALRDALGPDRVDVLKIDTEGFELFVLEGFPWERVEPVVIVAEFEDSKTRPLGYTTTDLVSFLRIRGYQVWLSEWHPIVRYGIRHQWRRLIDSEEAEPDPDSWGNLIAFRHAVPRTAIASCLEKAITFTPQ